MDALNKAEQAKRQGQAAEADAGGEAATLALELAPLTPAVTSPASPATPATSEAPPALPELPSDLQILDQEFMAHAAAAKPTAKGKKPPQPTPAVAHPAPVSAAVSAPAPAAIPQKAGAQEREAAQNLFAAKQPRPSSSKKTFAIVTGLLTLLAAVGGGIYFWLQLQPNNGISGVNGLNGLRQAAPPAPAPPAQAVQPAPPAPVVPAKPELAAPAPAAAVTSAAVAAAARDEAPSPIRISTAKLTLNPSLARGYAAYMAGDYAAAGSEYRQVLESEAKNIDALHGIAAIALRRGQADVAEEYFLRAIEANPQDALAQAGLIGLRGQSDPLQAETRLKTLLAAQPELPFLNLALGSLYARQNRWNEAQAAFFKATRAEPDNPDILFNLAVSLDQMHQPQLALQYYRQALAAAANRPASFDKAQVGARLRELQP